jgi:hypothetical protein
MRTRYVLPSGTLLAGGVGAATAQNAATYDPNQLPAIKGTVSEHSLAPRGDVDGLILADGTEVHLPPHLGTQLVYAVKPGDAVTIRGLRARAVPMVQAASVTNDATNSAVIDNGAGWAHGPKGVERTLTAQGRVKAQLHGPQGELNGVLLDDGTIVRLPPPEAWRLAADLTPGAAIYVAGEGFDGVLGRVIAADSIGPNTTRLSRIAAPPPGRGHRPPLAGPDLGPAAGPGAPPPAPRHRSGRAPPTP